MHELGHNLGLLHGGNANVNCKPNYFSVMNWAFQFPIYTSSPVPNPFPDYSKSVWPPTGGLIEGDLSEMPGIGPSGYQTVIGGGSPGFPLIRPFLPTGSAINYNDAGGSTDIHVTRNLNNFGYPSPISDDNCNSPLPPTTLFGYKDWGDSLQYLGHRRRMG